MTSSCCRRGRLTRKEANKLYSQLKDLDALSTQHPSIPLLKGVIKEFRDDELEHLDIAVDNFSQRAPGHALLSSVIGAGCKVAIEVCKRI
jgi:ubiquinone biosynthesis monooxygenase Coq7